jgi:hypothetical protein
MLNDVAFFVGGLLLGALTTASLAFPAVGRAVAKILAVVLLGIGFGFLVWASVTVYLGEHIRAPFGSNVITEVGEAFGWGAGLFLGGVVALCLAFWRRPTGRDGASGKGRNSSVHAEPGAPGNLPRA